jgi:hypothetical protein
MQLEFEMSHCLIIVQLATGLDNFDGGLPSDLKNERFFSLVEP